jgi:hypothetical protein
MFRLEEEYVDKHFEDEVLKLIPEKERRWDNRNQVLRFGSSIPYADNIVSSEIPAIFKTITDIEFDSVTINEYLEGQSIPYHIDREQGGETIHIISLLSDAVLKFKKGFEVRRHFMPRYSLVQFSGDLRWNWRHSLQAEHKRYSIVLRNSLNSKMNK